MILGVFVDLVNKNETVILKINISCFQLLYQHFLLPNKHDLSIFFCGITPTKCLLFGL